MDRLPTLVGGADKAGMETVSATRASRLWGWYLGLTPVKRVALFAVGAYLFALLGAAVASATASNRVVDDDGYLDGVSRVIGDYLGADRTAPSESVTGYCRTEFDGLEDLGIRHEPGYEGNWIDGCEDALFSSQVN